MWTRDRRSSMTRRRRKDCRHLDDTRDYRDTDIVAYNKTSGCDFVHGPCDHALAHNRMALRHLVLAPATWTGRSGLWRRAVTTVRSTSNGKDHGQPVDPHRGDGRRGPAALERLLEADVDVAERVRAVIVHFYQSAVEASLLGRLLADEFGRESERLDYLYEKYVEPTLAPLIAAVERLMAAGRMPTVPMDVLSFVVISPVAGLVQVPLAQRLGRPQPVTRESQERTARQLAELIVDGLLGDHPR
ncbi:hypothetical protein ACFS2C_17680 [Prauserella oleivorans]|uniref:Tetracyclin repressor-like C-terminal domain-containing protein n=2 Tax=Prauserella oleivorans TaxID=1478153 RepID=A0ABW5WBY1_9PSEU